MRFLVRAYAVAHRAGLLNTSFGDALFSSTYFAYKRLLEDPHAALIHAHPEIFRGGHVIDVGANIGYTAILFARAIDLGFSVFALEPEEENFGRLMRNLQRYHVADRVVARRVAAGAASGVIGLRVNPTHHGDHQVVPSGGGSADVPLVSLDELAASITGPIRFVKIDVQGYEPAVLAGMRKLLTSDLTISTEVDPAAVRSLGFSVADLESPLRGAAFSPYRIARDGELVPINHAEDAVDKRGYGDAIWRRG